MIRRLYEQGYQRQDIINLFKFIDWVMNLPEELEQEFEQQLSRYEEGLRMRYITSIERKGIRNGLLQGIELGLKLKFDTSGLNLFSEITDIEDLNLLYTIFNQIETVNTLDQIRAIYQSPSQQEENHHPDGIPKTQWMANLQFHGKIYYGREFQITEEDF